MAARLESDGDLMLAMALLGLRWSEMAALKVADVDLGRWRVRVVERATEAGGRMDVAASKGRASARTIATPPSLRGVLEARGAHERQARPDVPKVFPERAASSLLLAPGHTVTIDPDAVVHLP